MKKNSRVGGQKKKNWGKGVCHNKKSQKQERIRRETGGRGSVE